MMSPCTLRILAGWTITILVCVSFTSSAMLPKSNVDVLNRLVREKLFMKVIPELENVLTTIKGVQASTMACKQNIKRSYTPCANCIENQCARRYTECKIQSRKKVNLCDIVEYDQRAICSLTVNTEKFMLNVVKDIKNKLGANLRYAIYDMGSLVEKFIVKMGNYANGWNSNAAFAVKNAIKQIQTRYNIENERWVSDINFLSPEEEILRDMASAINLGMNKLGASVPNTGSFSYDLSRTLADLLSVHFNLGRKKRSLACKTLATGSTSCLFFRKNCGSCMRAPTSNSLNVACGVGYVASTKRLVDSLTRTTQIFEDVLSRIGFVQSAFYTTKSLQGQEIKFPNTKFTASIQGKPTLVYADFYVFNMPKTAGELANKIWAEWQKTV
ncbi:uncharacterized protein LOC117317967 [Pecten maximus]|uniref:uncharacterized protein LOC117317967 n=1 Tax=Pecten maximus TaxID=6579 RepID=UPI0014586575|nr:uncharacterized protein LOC117317967 [Pecten maximus]